MTRIAAAPVRFRVVVTQPVLAAMPDRDQRWAQLIGYLTSITLEAEPPAERWFLVHRHRRGDRALIVTGCLPATAEARWFVMRLAAFARGRPDPGDHPTSEEDLPPAS